MISPWMCIPLDVLVNVTVPLTVLCVLVVGISLGQGPWSPKAPCSAFSVAAAFVIRPITVMQASELTARAAMHFLIGNVHVSLVAWRLDVRSIHLQVRRMHLSLPKIGSQGASENRGDSLRAEPFRSNLERLAQIIRRATRNREQIPHPSGPARGQSRTSLGGPIGFCPFVRLSVVRCPLSVVRCPLRALIQGRAGQTEAVATEDIGRGRYTRQPWIKTME